MNARFATSAALAALVVGLTASPAAALIIATGPDDICAPTADPCIIDDKVENQAPGGQLDFGLREVRMTDSGRLIGEIDLRCGDFIVALSSTTKLAIDAELGNNVAGSVRITARGRCTGDAALGCSTDTTCSGAGAGTCDLGEIDITGKIHARGNPGGFVELRASGNITTHGDILNHGSPIGADGGTLNLDSTRGSIVTNGKLIARAAKTIVYETVNGGFLTMYAAEDVTINGVVDLGGSANGGNARINASRDILIHNSIECSAAGGVPEGAGGDIDLYAGDNIVITGSGPNQTGETRLGMNGSGGCTGDYYSMYCYVGYGGYSNIVAADGDISMDRRVKIAAVSGKVGKQGSARGGQVALRAYNGSVTFDGTANLVGYTNTGFGGLFTIDAGGGIYMGDQSQVLTKSKYGGSVYLNTAGGRNGDAYYGSTLDGRIDVRGELLIRYIGYYNYYGEGGNFNFYGDVDLDIGGKVQQGGDAGSGEFTIGACRIDLSNSALLDNKHGSPDNGGDIFLEAYEGIYASPGSVIRTDAQGGGEVSISYRSVDKPPVLLGTVIPAPDLDGGAPGAGGGCPVCGNAELDGGETCDDGNTTSGDGCRDDCQAELCIAQTPGFPGVSLCDDADACTADLCDPDTGCSNPISCEEGVECTVDACVLGACEHTPDDLLCDDNNDCTDDVCSVATGCVYANLTGGGCEDGDLCTVTGTCDTGTCVATDTSFAAASKLTVKYREGPGNDRISFKTRLPLAEFTADPSTTGIVIELRDSENDAIYTATLPAANIVSKGTKFIFKDSKFLVAGANGLTGLKISIVSSKNIAKVKLKTKNTEMAATVDQFRMSLSMLFGTDPVVDECVTARFIPCEPKSRKNVCKD